MLKRFFKDSFIYTVGGTLTRGLPFLLVPLLARILDKNEFGLYEYLSSLGYMFAIFATLEIGQAVIRFFPDPASNEIYKKKIISSSLFFVVLSYLAIFFFFVTLSGYFPDYIFGTNNISLVLAAIITYAGNSLIYLVSSIFRANSQPFEVIKIGFANAALTGSFGIISLLFIDKSIFTLLLSQILAQVIVIFVTFYRVKDLWFAPPSLCVLYDLLRFSVPLIFSSAAVIASLYVDRVFINLFLGIDSVAVYGVAAKFSTIINIASVGFQNALLPLIYSKHDDVSSPILLNKILKIYLLAAFTILLVVYFFGEWVVIIFAGEHYLSATVVMQILCLSVLIQKTTIFFPGLLIYKKTALYAGINVMSAVVNIALNYIFVPSIGVLGAAYSTAISSFFSLVLIFYFSQKFYRVPIFRH